MLWQPMRQANEEFPVFTHVMVGANSVASMALFYDAVLAHVGLIRTTDTDNAGPAGLIWQVEGIR